MVSPTLNIVIEATDAATPTIKNLESSIIRFVGSVSAALATIRTIAFPIQSAASLQTELLNVGKTTEFATDQLEQLRKGLIDVSQRMNVTAVDLAKIAAAGGQMGLGKEGVDGLLQFTETAARFSSVLNVSAEEAGAAIAKLSNIFNVSVKDAEKIGSLLNEISNNSTADGRDLVDMVQRIGTAGGTVGIKAAAALAATGRDLGLTVETVGTSFNKVFLDLQTKAGDIAGAMGIPVEAWSAKVRTDGIGALKDYLTFLSKMAPAQRAAFAEDTTGGGRIFALITSLVNDASNGFALLDKHLKEAADGFDGGTSAIKEQERVLGGLEAQYDILKNVLKNLAETVGKEALPYLTSLVKSFQEWAKQPDVINNLKAMGRYIGEMGKSLISALGALGPFIGMLSELGPYLRLFLAFKIGSYFVDMASGLGKGTKALIDHANAWRQVLTGNKAAIAQAGATVAAANAAAAQANAAGAATGRAAQQAVVPLVTRVGAAIGNMQALNTVLTQNGTVMAGLNARYDQYQQRIAAATSGAQKGGLTTQMNRIDAQRQALAAASNSLIQQQGVLGRITGAYNAFATAIGAATTPLGKITAAANAAGNAFVAFGRSATTAAGGAVGTIGARLAGMGSAIVAATTSWAGFGAAMSVVGGIASRFLFVWLPIATVIYSIADALGLVTPVVNIFKRLVGVTTESSESIAKREAVARQALEEEESSIRAVAAGYGKIAAEIAKAGEKAIAFGQAMKAAPVVQAQNQKIEIDINYEMKNQSILYDAINEAKTQLATLQAAYQKALSGGDTAKQADIAAQMRVAEQEISNLERASAASINESVRLQTQRVEAMHNMVAVQKSILQNFDDEGFALVRMIAEQSKYRSEVEQTAKRLADLESAGAKNSTNDSVRKDYAMVRGELDALDAKYKSFTAALDAELAKSSLSALRFVHSLVPDVDKVNFKDLSSQIASIELAFGKVGSISQQRMDEMERSVGSLESRIASLLVKADELRKSGDVAGSNQYKGESSVLQADLAKIKGMVDAYGDLKSAAKEARAAVAGSVSTPAERSKKDVEELIKAYAKIGTLKQLEAAQQSVVRATTQIAEDMKKKYESVFKDIQTRGEQTFNALADIQRTIATRDSSLSGAAFKQSQIKEAKDFELAIKDQETAIRHKALAQGMSRSEMENEINALHRMQEVLRRNFEANQDTARAEQEVMAKLREKQYIQGQLNGSMAKQEALVQAIKQAQDSGNAAKAAALAAELSRQADLTDGHFKDLQKTIAEIASLMAKTTQGLNENGTLKFSYDDAAIKQAAKGIDELLPKINELDARSRQSANSGAQAAATSASQSLTSVQEEIKKTQEVIDSFTKMAGRASKDTADQISLMLAGVTQSAPAFKDISTALQSIANADLRTGNLIGGITDMRTMLADIDKIAGGIAGKLSQNIEVTNLASLQDALRSMGNVQIKPDMSQVPGAMQNAIGSSTYTVGKFDMGNLPGEVQSSINSRTYRATIYADVIPQQAQGGPAGFIPRFAGGGRILGAGTGLSDSILAMLSHGEYVMDAQTVRTFGSGFFAMLQQLGQGSTGLASLRHALLSATIPSMALPRFASGGMIGTGIAGLTGGSASATEKVELTLNVGGGKYKVEGNRDQVRGLYNALRMLER